MLHGAARLHIDLVPKEKCTNSICNNGWALVQDDGRRCWSVNGDFVMTLILLNVRNSRSNASGNRSWHTVQMGMVANSFDGCRNRYQARCIRWWILYQMNLAVKNVYLFAVNAPNEKREDLTLTTATELWFNVKPVRSPVLKCDSHNCSNHTFIHKYANALMLLTLCWHVSGLAHDGR